MSARACVGMAALAVAIFVCRTQASLLIFHAEGTGTNVSFHINEKVVAADQVTSFLRLLHRADKDQAIYIRCSETNTTASLMSLLVLIADAGLTNVAVSCPIVRDGERGRQFIRLNLSEYPSHAASCTSHGTPLRDGFLSESEFLSWTNFIRRIEDVDEGAPVKTNARPAAAEHPRDGDAKPPR